MRVRRTTHLPAIAWHALVDHHHTGDTLRLAKSAELRGRRHEAEALYRHAAENCSQDTDVDYQRAVYRLGELLAEQGRLEEVAHCVEDLARPFQVTLTFGGTPAAVRLARLLDELLAKQTRIADSPQRADAGGENTSVRQTNLLVEWGGNDESQRADEADQDAGNSNVDWLAKESSAACPTAATQAVELLTDHRSDQLTQRADRGDEYASRRLADPLVEQRRIEELTQRADAGDLYAPGQLADLLVEHGRIEDLTQRADTGDNRARERLADLLANHGNIDELAQRADAGDFYASTRLGELLVQHGRIEELTRRADTGDPLAVAAYQLAWVLADEDCVAELAKCADTNDPWVAVQLCDLMVKEGRIEEAVALLRPHSRAGDMAAGSLMVDLLAALGWVDELDGEVAAGTPGAVAALRHAR
jgi:hypothetical protein